MWSSARAIDAVIFSFLAARVDSFNGHRALPCPFCFKYQRTPFRHGKSVQHLFPVSFLRISFQNIFSFHIKNMLTWKIGVVLFCMTDMLSPNPCYICKKTDAATTLHFLFENCPRTHSFLNSFEFISLRLCLQ